MVCNDFWADVKRSAKLSTAEPNKGEAGESKRAVLSVSLISVRFNTLGLAMACPIAWAIDLVARRVRSVALRSYHVIKVLLNETKLHLWEAVEPCMSHTHDATFCIKCR